MIKNLRKAYSVHSMSDIKRQECQQTINVGYDDKFKDSPIKTDDSLQDAKIDQLQQMYDQDCLRQINDIPFNIKKQSIQMFNQKISGNVQESSKQAIKETLDDHKKNQITISKSYEVSQQTQEEQKKNLRSYDSQNQLFESQFSYLLSLKQEQHQQNNRDYNFKSSWEDFQSNISVYSRRIVLQIKQAQNKLPYQQRIGKQSKSCNCEIM